MKRFLSFLLWVFIGVLGQFLGWFFLDNPDFALQIVNQFLALLIAIPAETPLNNFGYPYGEVEENVLDYYDAKGFSYSYISVEK